LNALKSRHSRGHRGSSFCSWTVSPIIIVSLIAWLGYVNSLLNPLIYTIFNPDFRRAFSRILRLDGYRTRTDTGAPAAGSRGPAAAAARSRDIERSRVESRQPVGLRPSAISL